MAKTNTKREPIKLGSYRYGVNTYLLLKVRGGTCYFYGDTYFAESEWRREIDEGAAVWLNDKDIERLAANQSRKARLSESSSAGSKLYRVTGRLIGAMDLITGPRDGEVFAYYVAATSLMNARARVRDYIKKTAVFNNEGVKQTMATVKLHAVEHGVGEAL